MVVRLLCAAFLASMFYSHPAWSEDGFLFAFPPREVAATQKETFQPIADLLSKAAGKPVTLQFTGNWMSYQQDMQEGKGDIVFDSPAFTGWRMAKHGFQPLVKLEGQLRFSVIAKATDPRIKSVKDLAGRPVCAFPLPNMVTLAILHDQFDNPVRQPITVSVKNFQQAYEWLLADRCKAIFIISVMVERIDQKKLTQTLYQTKTFPNPAISVSTRVPPEVRQKMVEALLSPEGALATKRLRAEFGGLNFVAVEGGEYDGLGAMLKDLWGLNI